MPPSAEAEPAAATDAAPAEPEAATSTDQVAAETPQADQGAEVPDAAEPSAEPEA